MNIAEETPRARRHSSFGDESQKPAASAGPVFGMDFPSFVKKYAKAKVAIGLHRNADPDALCSGYALSTIFPDSILITPDDMGLPAKSLAAELGIKVHEFKKTSRAQYEGLIVVDAGSYSMIKEARDWKILGLIDHHQKSPPAERIAAEFELWDAASPSTCQLVSQLIQSPEPKAAFALAVGIVSDTARFKGGNAQSFSELARLLGICGKSYKEVLEWAEPERAPEEKMAMLSALSRAKCVAYKNFVIATTTVGGNESDASSSLSEFADISFAASWKAREKTTRVSARARKNVKIAMNEIMAAIGKRFGATGGGHAKAAGANALEKPEAVLEACVSAVKDALDTD
ncbi:MAG: DHH family phosphoesterase [Candidatus Micrarchaeia archaeon]